MNKQGPIIVIEDDLDDQELVGEVFKEINNGNEVVFFSDSLAALDYLTTSAIEPFLILSDINLPTMDGFDLRAQVFTNERLVLKCIPYLFFTTSTSQDAIVKAYSQSVQGFFIKPNSISELRELLSAIVTYWNLCKSPNKV